MFQIHTYNKISKKGLSRFCSDKYRITDDLTQADAILLRSHKLEELNLTESILAVARAGAGTNNVPVDDCTNKGIVVFNTPGANANAVKEMVISSLLLSSRGILQGRDFVAGLGDIDDATEMSALLEKEKKRFAGKELFGKTLGIVGLGAIGSMVAEIALALGMDVVGYDPALSIEAAWKLSSRVRRMETLEALLGEVDYLTLHVPALAETKHLINQQTLKLMKADAAILNFARGVIVDAEAVVQALDENRLRHYICDFPEPCLIGNDKVIAVPHIGASTAEAEENCAIMAVDQLRDFLENGHIKNSVNFPNTSMSRGDSSCRIAFTNKNVPGVLGHLLTVFADNKVNVIEMVNKSRGDIAYNILDLEEHPSKEVVELIKNVKHVIHLRLI